MAAKRRRFDVKNSDMQECEEEENETVYRYNNNVYFHCDVSKTTVLMLIKELTIAAEYATQHRCGEDKVVFLYIHSDGGDAFAGLSAMSHIRRCSVPVVTIADALVASAASFMLIAGSHRKIMEFSEVLIHQVRAEYLAGKFSEIVDETTNLKSLMKTMQKIYRKFTCMSPTRIKHLLNQEVTLNAKDCLKNGIVDEIVRI